MLLCCYLNTPVLIYSVVLQGGEWDEWFFFFSSLSLSAITISE